MYNLLSTSLMNLDLYDYEPHKGVCMLDQNSFGILHIIWSRKFQILLFFCVPFSPIICDVCSFFPQTIIQGELSHVSKLLWVSLVMFLVIWFRFVIGAWHSIMWSYDSSWSIKLRTESEAKSWILCFVGDVILKPILIKYDKIFSLDGGLTSIQMRILLLFKYSRVTFCTSWRSKIPIPCDLDSASICKK